VPDGSRPGRDLANGFLRGLRCRARDRLCDLPVAAAEKDAEIVVGAQCLVLESMLECERQATKAVPILCERGALAEARALLERIERKRPTSEAQAVCSRAVAEAYLLRLEGRPRDALQAAERALDAAIGSGDFRIKRAEIEAVESALAAGDEDRARELLARSQSRPPGELTPFLRAEQARLRARLEPGRAPAELGLAEDLYRELGARFQLAVTLLARAELLDVDERRPLLAEARGIFEELEARPWLERLDTLEGRLQPTAAAGP
jgi:hypothetical protein